MMMMMMIYKMHLCYTYVLCWVVEFFKADSRNGKEVRDIVKYQHFVL